jgi:4-amino-4-deoxy-L-arabinose transferase-like glycosyltransferase
MSTIGGASSHALWSANRAARLFDFAVSKHRRAICLLILGSLIAFLPGFSQIPPVDRDEPRYAQGTKQMLESGDYVDIRFQDEKAYTKPVGIYWLQAAAVAIGETLGVADARKTIWLYRMPSLLGAIGAVLATYWCALGFISRRGATLAALMMMASVLLGVEARLAKTDAVLLFTVILAMGALARVYLPMREAKAARPGIGLLAIFWTAVAFGVLVKGLVILMVVGLTAIALSVFDRSWRWVLALRPLPGIAWAGVLALPWLVAISTRVGDTFLADSVGHDTLGKLVNSQQGHGQPPGFYLLLFFITFFPGSVLTGMAAPAVIAKRREPAIRFLLAWLVPSWIVFELAVTKLPHYVLPLYPAVAILLAIAIENNMLSRRPWLVRGAISYFLVPLVVSIVVIVGAIVISRDYVLPASPFLGAAIVCGLLAWRLCEDDGVERALMYAAAVSVLTAVGIDGFIIPALSPLFPSPALVHIMQESGCAHPVAATAGYQEPSLVFLAGTSTLLTDAAGAAELLRQGGCRFAFIEKRQEQAFASRAQTNGLGYDRRASIVAFNLGHVQRINIAGFQSKDAGE